MFSERLKKLRTERHLTQKELAKSLEMSQQIIAKWENNQSTPNPDMLVKITDFFDISADYLLGRTDEEVSISTNLKLEIKNFNHNHLQELMKSKNCSLENIAQLLHLNKYEITMYLSGIKCPTEKELQQLSEYFQCPIEFINGELESPNICYNFNQQEKNHQKLVVKQIQISEEETYLIINEKEKEFILSILDMIRKKY